MKICKMVTDILPPFKLPKNSFNWEKKRNQVPL